MKHNFIITALPGLVSAALLFATPWQCLAQNTFTDAETDGVKAFLRDNFNGRKDCMVIGLLDEHSGKVFGGGTLDNGTTNVVNGDSVFFIGSITKTFTALLLQDMADCGDVKRLFSATAAARGVTITGLALTCGSGAASWL